jgi:V8-like Glu-specific endopeptidase
MRHAILSAVLAAALLTPVGRGDGQPIDAEDGSIVQIVVVDDTANMHGVGSGTGFVVSPDGLALTNAHVVYRIAQEPSRYRLIALVGQEFGSREWYGASLVCATRLPYDPTKTDHDVPFTKDVAALKLEPSFLAKRWGYALPEGQRYDYEPHSGALPNFAPLRLAATDPGVSEAVKTTGFSVISPLPRLFMTVGEITRTFAGRDGVPIVEMTFPNPTERGASGSPILNVDGEVIAINAWGVNVGARGDKAWGVAASALHHPCGDVTL